MKVEVEEARRDHAVLERHRAPVVARLDRRGQKIDDAPVLDEQSVVARLGTLGIHQQGASQGELHPRLPRLWDPATPVSRAAR